MLSYAATLTIFYPFYTRLSRGKGKKEETIVKNFTKMALPPIHSAARMNSFPVSTSFQTSTPSSRTR